MSKKSVYLDNAAATALDPKVIKAMKPFLEVNFSNPSALYDGAVKTKDAIFIARKRVANALSTQPDTIIFTSGGTESINIGILGVCYKLQKEIKNPHIITTKIEHKAVLEPIKHLENSGFEVTYLDVNSAGFIRIEEFKKALRPETVLVSIQYANNEIGTIQPIADIGREILKWRKIEKIYPYFHTDACQAAAYLDLDVEKLHMDLMSLNGSKIYGPKGVGVLYKRRGVSIEPLMYGGGQEFGLRPGTENVAGIVGMGEAMSELRLQTSACPDSRVGDFNQIEKLRNYFWEELKTIFPEVILNGPSSLMSQVPSPKSDRLPNNLNVTVPGIDTEVFIIYLDEMGVQCSSGSACSAESDEVSHVLKAIGLSIDEARSSIRFTLGKNTTQQDIKITLNAINKSLKYMRSGAHTTHS